MLDTTLLQQAIDSIPVETDVQEFLTEFPDMSSEDVQVIIDIVVKNEKKETTEQQSKFLAKLEKIQSNQRVRVVYFVAMNIRNNSLAAHQEQQKEDFKSVTTEQILSLTAHLEKDSDFVSDLDGKNITELNDILLGLYEEVFIVNEQQKKKTIDKKRLATWRRVQSLNLKNKQSVLKSVEKIFANEDAQKEFKRITGVEWNEFNKEVKEEVFLNKVRGVTNQDHLEKAWNIFVTDSSASKWQETLRALFDNASYTLETPMTPELKKTTEAMLKTQTTDALLEGIQNSWKSLADNQDARDHIKDSFQLLSDHNDWIKEVCGFALPDESRREEFNQVLIDLHKQVEGIESGYEVDNGALDVVRREKANIELERDQLQLLNKVFVELSDWWEKPAEAQAKLDAISEEEWQKIERSGDVAINFLQNVKKSDIIVGTLGKVTLEGLKESLGVREEFLTKKTEIQTEFDEFAAVDKIGSLPVKFKQAFRKATAKDQWGSLCGRTEWNEAYENSSYQNGIQSWMKDMIDQRSYLERLSTAEENAQILQNRLKD